MAVFAERLAQWSPSEQRELGAAARRAVQSLGPDLLGEMPRPSLTTGRLGRGSAEWGVGREGWGTGAGGSVAEGVVTVG